MCWVCGKETIFLLLPPKTYNIKPHTKHIFTNVTLVTDSFRVCAVWTVVKDQQPAYARIIVIFAEEKLSICCKCVCWAKLYCTVLCFAICIDTLGCGLVALLLPLLFIPFISVYFIYTQTSQTKIQTTFNTYNISASFLVWKVRFHFQPNKRWCECLSVMVFRGRMEWKKKHNPSE